MAAKGEIPSQSRITERGRRFVVVSNTFVQENANRLSPGCCLRDASRVLGLPQAWLRYLVPALCGDVHPPRRGGIWDVPKSWIAGLKGVVAAAPLVPDRPPDRMCTVQVALRNKLIKNATGASLIRALSAGSGPPVWRKANTTAFGKLLLRWEDVCEWERSGALVGPTAIGLPCAARVLRVKEEVVYALVRSGLLQASVDQGRQKLARYTSKRWIEEFNSQYVFGRDVAHHFSRSSKWMAQWLREQGIEAVAGPGVDSCRQLVYRRDAVTSASALLPGGDQPLQSVRAVEGRSKQRRRVGMMKSLTSTGRRSE